MIKLNFRSRSWVFLGIFLLFSTSSVVGIMRLSPNTQASEVETKVNWYYMTLHGLSTGFIEGDVNDAGREGWIEVLSYHHQIYQPPDGHRIHSPLRIIKPVDKASPLLMMILINHETIANLTLEFWRTNQDSGHPEHWYTIYLENVNIESIESFGTTETRATECIAFIYQKITWTHEIYGIEVQDDLSSPT